MKQQFTIDVPVSCAVLLSLWNRKPEEVLQFYADHLCFDTFLNRMGGEKNLRKMIRSKKGNIQLLVSMANDPYGAAAYFFIKYGVIRD